MKHSEECSDSHTVQKLISLNIEWVLVLIVLPKVEKYWSSFKNPGKTISLF